MQYDDIYKNSIGYFGDEPERILKKYYRLLNKTQLVLDIGAGQGRNAIFLANEGFMVEAIDPSRVAMDFVAQSAKSKGLSIRTYHCGFESFAPEANCYSGILIFGLIQILSWSSIRQLMQKLDEWLTENGLIFMTAFTTGDPSFARYSTGWKHAGKNSFTDSNNNYHTYLETGQIVTLLKDYKVIHHREGLGPWHRHGNRAPERHSMAEAVIRKYK